jgi:outer membrane biosynthesis protein TonB
MVFTDISLFERIGRRNATIAASTFALLVLLMLLIQLPLEGKTEEEKLEEELGGVTVALGWPDMGSNNDTPSEGGGEQVPPDPTPTPPSAQPSAPSPATPPPAAVITGEDPEVKYAREKAREDQKQRLKEQDDIMKKAKADAEAKETVRRAEQAKSDAKAAAEAAEQAARDKKKSGIGDLFKKPGSTGGTGNGSGNSGNAGNGGRPDGSPDSKRLEGEGSGNGTGRSIGGGLGSRAVQGNSPVSKNYNESGSVTVKVCVDESGRVTSATAQNVGTNTSSTVLRGLAEANARSYRFAAGEGSTCGTILYTFKVK